LSRIRRRTKTVKVRIVQSSEPTSLSLLQHWRKHHKTAKKMTRSHS
jgi:hypothetical protein